MDTNTHFGQEDFGNIIRAWSEKPEAIQDAFNSKQVSFNGRVWTWDRNDDKINIKRFIKDFFANHSTQVTAQQLEFLIKISKDINEPKLLKTVLKYANEIISNAKSSLDEKCVFFAKQVCTFDTFSPEEIKNKIENALDSIEPKEHFEFAKALICNNPIVFLIALPYLQLDSADKNKLLLLFLASDPQEKYSALMSTMSKNTNTLIDEDDLFSDFNDTPSNMPSFQDLLESSDILGKLCTNENSAVFLQAYPLLFPKPSEYSSKQLAAIFSNCTKEAKNAWIEAQAKSKAGISYIVDNINSFDPSLSCSIIVHMLLTDNKKFLNNREITRFLLDMKLDVRTDIAFSLYKIDINKFTECQVYFSLNKEKNWDALVNKIITEDGPIALLQHHDILFAFHDSLDKAAIVYESCILGIINTDKIEEFFKCLKDNPKLRTCIQILPEDLRFGLAKAMVNSNPNNFFRYVHLFTFVSIDLQSDLIKLLVDKAPTIFIEHFSLFHDLQITPEAIKEISPQILPDLLYLVQNHPGRALINFGICSILTEEKAHVFIQALIGSVVMRELKRCQDNHEHNYTLLEGVLYKLDSILDKLQTLKVPSSLFDRVQAAVNRLEKIKGISFDTDFSLRRSQTSIDVSDAEIAQELQWQFYELCLCTAYNVRIEIYDLCKNNLKIFDSLKGAYIQRLSTEFILKAFGSGSNDQIDNYLNTVQALFLSLTSLKKVNINNFQHYIWTYILTDVLLSTISPSESKYQEIKENIAKLEGTLKYPRSNNKISPLDNFRYCNKYIEILINLVHEEYFTVGEKAAFLNILNKVFEGSDTNQKKRVIDIIHTVLTTRDKELLEYIYNNQDSVVKGQLAFGGWMQKRLNISTMEAEAIDTCYNLTFDKERQPHAFITYLTSLHRKSVDDSDEINNYLCIYFIGVLTGTFNIDRYDTNKSEHLQRCFSAISGLETTWKITLSPTPSVNLSKYLPDEPPNEVKNWLVLTTDSYIDLLLCGSEVTNCMNISDGAHNDKLVGHLLNGKNQLIAIKNKDGTMTANVVVKLLLLNGKPVLFAEKIYHKIQDEKTQKCAQIMIEYELLRRGSELGIPVYCQEPFTQNSQLIRYEDVDIDLEALNDICNIEYVDTNEGEQKGPYHIKKNCYEVVPK